MNRFGVPHLKSFSGDWGGKEAFNIFPAAFATTPEVATMPGPMHMTVS